MTEVLKLLKELDQKELEAVLEKVEGELFTRYYMPQMEQAMKEFKK